jgi:hypothetical protein
MIRKDPSKAWLKQSRRLNNVPPSWTWGWCSNERCTQIVWFDPAAKAATLERGLEFVLVCSGECALAVMRQREAH